eukprot:m.434594 g.434594  ORF g.434594 m.434594 type:complete len:358 (-) comp17738_c0_seq1:61-1134(-)
MAGALRQLARATANDPAIGAALRKLPGVWQSQGRGWNSIAVPFKGAPFYRLLLNQYNETLSFAFADKNVPNRGVRKTPTGFETEDQFVLALDYDQRVNQIAVTDFPVSDQRGEEGQGIHREVGMWLQMKDFNTGDIDIARMSTIPHGNAVLALGTSREITDRTELDNFCIPRIDGLPPGGGDFTDPEERQKYLEPYVKLHETPFNGKVDVSQVEGFPGFSPVEPHHLLNFNNKDLKFSNIIELAVDTEVEEEGVRSGGVNNIPFAVKQAEAVSMKSTFWIQELDGVTDADGNPQLQLQYAQTVMIDFFFPRKDGHPGRIKWPHVSINTLRKLTESAGEEVMIDIWAKDSVDGNLFNK